MDRVERNWLPNVFYAKPETAVVLLTGRELRETMLRTNGKIIAKANLWTIKNKKVAPGTYEVRLELDKAFRRDVHATD